jgi:hypothetical protein
MGFSEERNKKWRVLQQEEIKLWQEHLKNQVTMMRTFSYERLEMEVLQLLNDNELKEIWSFSCQGVHRRKSNKLRNIYIKAKNEIEKLGTIEPIWRSELICHIRKEKRKMQWLNVKKKK